MSKDLTNEGSVTFIIDVKENPHFKDPNSNITFMYNYNVGGIILNLVKEKTTLRVGIENTKVGISKIETDISKILNKNMMVALTWTKESAKLYLNGEFISESRYT